MEGTNETGAHPDVAERARGRRRKDQARPDAQQVGRDILGVLRPEPFAEPAPPVAVTEPTEPTSPPAPTTVREDRVAAPTGASTSVEFPPRRGVRRFLSVAFVVALLAAGGAAYVAYANTNKLTISVAATLAVLMLFIWAIRAGSPLTYLAVRGGQLDIRSGGLHRKFDLSSRYTPIEVHGTPGRPGWKVVFGAGSTEPFVVDSSLVDAQAFMDVLLRYRPD